MKNYFLFNFAFIMFFNLLHVISSRGIQIFPFDEMNNDEINPFNAFLNFDRMANELMKEMKEDSIPQQKGDEEEENSIVPLNNGKHKKISKKGSVQIEERKNKDGMQRKIVRDLGNGVKSVEITQVYNRNPRDIKEEQVLDPFGGIPNMGFPGIGVPTIIISRKNLKKKSRLSNY